MLCKVMRTEYLIDSTAGPYLHVNCIDSYRDFDGAGHGMAHRYACSRTYGALRTAHSSKLDNPITKPKRI